MKNFEMVRNHTDKDGNYKIEVGLEPNSTYLSFILNAPITTNSQYRRDIFSALSNTYSDLTTRFSVSKKEYGSVVNEDDMNIEFVYMLKSVGDAISYLSNSQSGRDFELHDFDKYELKKRFEKIINILDK